MSLPVGWPAPSEVETLPTVWLALEGSAWPPAGDDRPAGVAPVGSWSVERELVGSTLPGNIRARSGLSVGSASAEVAQTAEGLAPWAIAPARRVVTGAKAELYASHDGYDSDARIDFGDWRVDPTSGSLTSAGVQVQLIERQYEGRKQEHRMPPPDMPLGGSETDPAWIIDRVARQMGYYLTPPPSPSCLVSFPMTGSATVEYPTEQGLTDMEVLSWGSDLGMVGPAIGDWYGNYKVPFDELNVPMVGNQQTLYLTLNVQGEAGVLIGEGHAVKVSSDGTFSVTNDYGVAPWVGETYVTGSDPNHPRRVQVEVVRTKSGSNWVSCVARARSSAVAAWSSAATSSGVRAEGTFAGVILVSGSGIPGLGTGSANGFQMTLAPDPELFAASEKPIDLPALGGIIDSPFVGGDSDVWTVIQEVCAAWCAACVVMTDGTLKVLPREELAGVGVTPAVMDVGATFEDLAWSLDPGEVADRLEVTFNPPSREVYVSGSKAPILWQATEVIEVGPKETITVKAQLDRGGNVLLSWAPAWVSGLDADTSGTWSAFLNAEGSGAHVGTEDLALTTKTVSSSLVEITVTNTLTDRVYLVDATGAPCLILRAGRVASFETQQTLSRGALTENALNPISVDLGYYVQRREDAEDLADYLWARVSTPMWKASSVRVRLDWEHDIGRVLQLTHERSGLDVKALVTKVAWSGSAGEIAQSLDLVLLPATWSDFDDTWAGLTWNDWDAWFADNVWTDFDAEPTGGP